MKVFAILTLLITVCYCGVPRTCNIDMFKKVGCFKKNEKLFHDMMITDLDPSHHKWGQEIDWANFGQSLQSLACRCAAKVKGKYNYFAIGFYGECWAGSNTKAIRDTFHTRGPHTSDQCIDGTFSSCDKNSRLCAGIEDNEYVYQIEEDNPIGDYKCALQTGIGTISGSWQRLQKELISTGGTPEACWKDCAKKGGKVNGVSYDKPPKKCWCVSGMNRIVTKATAWQACFIETVVPVDISEYKCAMQTGIGTISRSWKRLEKELISTGGTPEACWKDCVKKGGKFNGVSYDKPPKKCWCVSGMNRIVTRATAWQACFIEKV